VHALANSRAYEHFSHLETLPKALIREDVEFLQTAEASPGEEQAIARATSGREQLNRVVTHPQIYLSKDKRTGKNHSA
jgi:hypothetical protein